MAEHTPTPWHIAGKATIKHGNDMWVGTLNQRHRAANAAFIVRAVNSHDALVKALQETSAILAACVRADKLSELDDFSFTGKWKNLGRIRVSKVLDDADAALALCEKHEKTGGEG